MTTDPFTKPLDVDTHREGREVRFEPGWLKRQVEKSIASLDRLPPDIRAALDPPYMARNRRRPGRPADPR